MSDSLDPKRVTDAHSFLEFVRALQADRENAERLEAQTPSSPYGPDAGGWENITIARFLGGAVSWAEDTDFGQSQGIDPSNAWQACAVFLYCGKIYEQASRARSTEE